MKDKGILFKPEMVRAILDGRKTMTRRVVKDCKQFKDWNSSPSNAYDVTVDGSNAYFLVAGDQGYTDAIKSPYQIGQKLWVKETWGRLLCTESGYKDEESRCLDCQNCRNAVTYLATSPNAKEEEEIEHWKASMFMPRWASRITLEVTAVRVERLNEISQSDATAEGVTPDNFSPDGWNNAQGCFQELWESINGKGSFDSRWVWVIEFKGVKS